MTANRPKLNSKKTELLWACSRHSAAVLGINGPSLKLGQDTVAPTPSVSVSPFVWPDSGWSRYPRKCDVFLLAPSAQTSSMLLGWWRNEDAGPSVHFFAWRLLYRSSSRMRKSTTDTLQRVLNAADRLVSNTHKYDRGLSSLLHGQLLWLVVPEWVEYKLAVVVCRCVENKALKSTALRLPPSGADVYDQPTNISWLYRAVGGLHLAVGQAFCVAGPRSGTHYRLSFIVWVPVLVVTGYTLKSILLGDISAFSTIEMRCLILCYHTILILFYSILFSLVQSLAG